MDTKTVEWKRIGIFVLISFGLAWLLALYLFLDGAKWQPGETGIDLKTTLILAVGYMSTPAIANVATRWLTKEGWKNAFVTPNLRRGWKYWLLAWVTPAALTVIGGLIYFLEFPQLFDPEMTSIMSMVVGAEIPSWLSPTTLLLLQLIQAVFISPLMNSVVTFGEEFGWRGYLLQKLLALGPRKGLLLSGVIWGLWHAPLIAMGHNYGRNYPGWPIAGIVMMTIFCISAGTLLAWLSLRGRSVWPAVIGHAAMNGIAGLGLLVTKDPGSVNMLLGPTPAGLIGGIGFIVVAAVLLVTAPRWAVAGDKILE
ncbi:MAG TPA: CPBP family intramembrane metalloprotease [Bellilinea sp.]|nr:CPBP family intramembrane metalloprotease [Bellilinea sp.]